MLSRLFFFGLDFTNPDFVKYAETYEAIGQRVGTAAQFHTIVEDAFNAGGVHLIEVPMDYTDNDRILNHEIKEASAKL